MNTRCFIRKWFIRKQYSAAQKVKKVQYWVLATKESLQVHLCLKFDFICHVSCPLTVSLLFRVRHVTMGGMAPPSVFKNCNKVGQKSAMLQEAWLQHFL